jgi:hypothetical protein
LLKKAVTQNNKLSKKLSKYRRKTVSFLTSFEISSGNKATLHIYGQLKIIPRELSRGRSKCSIFEINLANQSVSNLAMFCKLL